MRSRVGYLFRLKMDWSCPGEVDKLERDLLCDPSVVEAVMLAGRIDFFVFTFHADVASAAAWEAAFRQRACVTWLRGDPVSIRFDWRPDAAARSAAAAFRSDPH